MVFIRNQSTAVVGKSLRVGGEGITCTNVQASGRACFCGKILKFGPQWIAFTAFWAFHKNIDMADPRIMLCGECLICPVICKIWGN